MAMENGPVEDVFPLKNGDFYCHVSLLEGRFHCEIKPFISTNNGHSLVDLCGINPWRNLYLVKWKARFFFGDLLFSTSFLWLYW